jgi:Sec-independent protein translocase protein TatA
MSFSEVLVVFIIGVLVLSPEDLKALIKNFYQLKKYLTDLRDQIFAPLQAELDKLEESTCQDVDEINFYLEKIANLNQKYEGDYSLEKIKKHYYDILKGVIKS